MFSLCTILSLALGVSQAVAQGHSGGEHQGGGNGDNGGGNGGGHGGFGGRPGAEAPSGPWRGEGDTWSPKYNYMFERPLPIPPVMQPEYSETINGTIIDYYELIIQDFDELIYPDLGPTHLVGYNGMAPGPTFLIQRYHETIVRCLNRGSADASIHLHGSYTHAPWDGWAEDKIKVGQWKDYYYPNTEPARPIWYHDHVEGDTAANTYYGQAGIYIIYDPDEDSLGLPSGDYDVAMAIADKKYQSNGELLSPDGSTQNFFGDVIHVNARPWPYLAVEPRKYRFRFYDMSLSRGYDLYFEDPDGNLINFKVIASDSGLFGSPVDSSDLTISMGERYEVVIDFAGYGGQNITLKNGLQIEHINDFENTDLVMQFNVGDSVSDDSNNGDVPGTLNPNVLWPEPSNEVSQTFDFQQGGGGADWTINGIPFSDVNNRLLASPELGSTELWEVRHTGGPAIHPVHIHLVNLQVISRSGGTRGVLPYETAGLKDTVLLEPFETVRILAYYGPWPGVYMFHCHNLIHEDHEMMASFNVTLLEELGYDMNTAYIDPLDSRFQAQAYSDEAFTSDGIKKAVRSFANLNAYAAPASAIAERNAPVATPAPAVNRRMTEEIRQAERPRMRGQDWRN